MPHRNEKPSVRRGSSENGRRRPVVGTVERAANADVSRAGACRRIGLTGIAARKPLHRLFPLGAGLPSSIFATTRKKFVNSSATPRKNTHFQRLADVLLCRARMGIAPARPMTRR